MIDPFLDPARPHMARGAQMLGSVPVVVTPEGLLRHSRIKRLALQTGL